MSDFDWDADSLPADDFDWDRDTLPDAAPAARPDVSPAVSATRGFLQGATFGLSDEINAGGEALWDALTTDKSLGDAYRERRSMYRDLNRASQEVNPKSYVGGELVGAVAAPVPGGAATGLGKVALRSGLEGAAYGLGASEADLTEGEFGQAALDAAAGGAFGVGGGVLGHGAGKLVTKGAQALKAPLQSFANERATKAAGLIQKDLNRMTDKEAVGRYLLEKGLLKPFRTPEDLRPGFEAARRETGENIGALLREASEATGGPGAAIRSKVAERVAADADPMRVSTPDPRAYTEGLGFDLREFTDTIRSRVLPELSDPAFDSIRKDVLRKLALYERKAAAGVDFNEANRMKTNLQQTISKFVDAPASQQAKLKLQGTLDDAIEGQIGRTLGPDKLAEFTDAKRGYGLLSEAVKGAKGAEKRAAGNRWTSPSDYGTGIGAAGVAALATGGDAVSSLATGALVAAVHKALRERGASASAVAVHSALKKLAQADPAAFERLAQRFGARSPVTLADDELEDFKRRIVDRNPP